MMPNVFSLLQKHNNNCTMDWLYAFINKQTNSVSSLKRDSTTLSNRNEAHLYFTQTDVNRRLLQPNRGFALLHEPGEELLDVLLQLQRNTTHTDSRADHSSHETCLFERKPALYLAPLRSLAVQISRYRLRSTCFPMDRTARLDRPLLLRPIDGNMRFTTSTSHCSFILKKNQS